MDPVRLGWAVGPAVLFAAALFGSTALARPAVTQDQAAAIAQDITDRIALAVRGPEGWTVALDGKVEVVPQDGFYRVRLPALVGVAPSDGRSFRIAALGFALTPLTDTRYRVSELEMPARIFEATDASGTVAVTVRGDRRFEGDWSSAHASFLDIDAAWSDVSVTADGVEAGRIGALEMSGRSSDRGTIDQDMRVSLRDLAFDMRDDRGEVRVGALDLTGFVREVDAAGYAGLKRLFRELGRIAEPTPENLAALQDHLATMDRPATGFGIAIRLHDLWVDAPAQGLSVALDSLRFALNVDGLDTLAASAGLTYEHSGLAIDPSPYPPELLPAGMSAALWLLRFPATEAWPMMLDAFDAVRDGLDGGLVTAQLGMALFDAAVASRSRILLDPVTLASPSTELTLTGRGDLAPEFPFGFLGSATLVVRGLEAAVDATAAIPDPERAMEAQALLGMLQALGASERDAADGPALRYDLTFAPDGWTLIGERSADAARMESR